MPHFEHQEVTHSYTYDTNARNICSISTLCKPFYEFINLQKITDAILHQLQNSSNFGKISNKLKTAFTDTLHEYFKNPRTKSADKQNADKQND